MIEGIEFIAREMNFLFFFLMGFLFALGSIGGKPHSSRRCKVESEFIAWQVKFESERKRNREWMDIERKIEEIAGLNLPPEIIEIQYGFARGTR
jgi:hypothetical protein